MAGNGKFDIEHRIILPDKTIKYVHEKGELVYNNEGRPVRFEGTVQDVTNQRKVADEIKQLATRLLLATISARLGIWDLNLLDDHLVWDEGMFKLYDISHLEFKSNYDEWLNTLHPEDKIRVNEELRMAIAGIKEYNTEFRIVWSDMSVHYIRATGMIESDATGKAIRMIGTNWDITEQKEK